MQRAKIIFLSILMISLASCAGKSKTTANTPAKETGEMPMTYKMVSMAEGIEIAKSNPNAIIVDVRRKDEYQTGRIPGAVLLTMETITAETASKVLPDKNQTILVYCRSGRRSKIAAKKLLELGYTNLIEIGGILEYDGKVER